VPRGRHVEDDGDSGLKEGRMYGRGGRRCGIRGGGGGLVVIIETETLVPFVDDAV
jgi:hypothetical protein